jgi:hypothetical protein
MESETVDGRNGFCLESHSTPFPPDKTFDQNLRIDLVQVRNATDYSRRRHGRADKAKFGRGPRFLAMVP